MTQDLKNLTLNILVLIFFVGSLNCNCQRVPAWLLRRLISLLFYAKLDMG